MAVTGDASFDPFSPEAMRNPLDLYARLRDRDPVHYMPRWDTFAVSRFDDVWQALRDPDDAFVGVEGTVPTPQALARHNERVPEAPGRDPLVVFARYPSPTYEQVRRAHAGPLRPAPVSRLESLTRGLARARLDALADTGRFDLTQEYAGQVTAAVMCHLLGLPLEDAPVVLETVNRVTLSDPEQGGVDPAQIHRQCLAILEPVVARAREGAGMAAPMVEGLVELEVDGRRLTDREVASQLVQVFVGGTETVPKIVAHGLWELRRHPEQLAAVRGDLARNVPIVREEMIRYCAPAQWFLRTVARPTTVAGREVRPGQRVMLLFGSAARDPREFDEPDTFRWDRPIERVLSFGRGQRFCMGVHLARLEVTVLVEEFLSRFPDYRVVESAATRLPSSFQWGWNSVPVEVA